MSKIKLITDLIFSNFNDSEVFSTATLHELAVKNGIISESDSNSVNNTLFALKKDTRLKKVARGMYQVIYSNDDFNESESTEKLFELLIDKLKSYKKMNPIDANKNDMIKAALEVDKYRKYISVFQDLLNNKTAKTWFSPLWYNVVDNRTYTVNHEYPVMTFVKS